MDDHRSQQFGLCCLLQDKKVLRFWGYFEEVVDPSIVGSAPLDSAARKVWTLLFLTKHIIYLSFVPLQNVRVRECSVLFFLEDGTIQAEEKRQDNSGMMQARLSWRTSGASSVPQTASHQQHQRLTTAAPVPVFPFLPPTLRCPQQPRAAR